MEIRIPKMEEWEQIGGDNNPGAYGAMLARSDGDALELLEIQPVREYVGDDEAAEVGFPWWTKEGYFYLDDLDPDDRDVRRALETVGMSRSELERETPTTRALIIAEALMSYGRSEEGPAGWAKDVVPGEVKWWKGRGGAEFFADEEEEFRIDVLGEDEEDEDDEDDED